MLFTCGPTDTREAVLREVVSVCGVRRQARTVAPGCGPRMHGVEPGKSGDEPSASSRPLAQGGDAIAGGRHSCEPSKRDGAAAGRRRPHASSTAPVTTTTSGARFVFLELPHSRKHRFQSRPTRPRRFLHPAQKYYVDQGASAETS